MKPRSVERIPLWRLAPHERKELESLLAAHRKGAAGDAFLSDEGDSSAWWLLLGLAGLGGAGACATFVWESGLDGLRWFPKFLADYGVVSALRSQQWLLGLVTCTSVVAWIARTWILNHKRRGYAVTSFATLRVKGTKAALLRHADVARLEWTQIVTRTQRFSVLKLTSTDGRHLTLYVHAGWVRVAIAQIDQARAAAGLPPIQGDARIVPAP